MTVELAYFPMISSKVASAARVVYGRNNPYLAIGDKVEMLYNSLQSTNIAGWHDTPAKFMTLTLATLFQFIEGLPDRQAVEAVHSRLDWQYALHLSPHNQEIKPFELCQFRQFILTHPAAQAILQNTYKLFREARITKGYLNRDVSAVEITGSICKQTRSAWLSEALVLAIEALDARYTDWLDANGLPHWHYRYLRQRPMLQAHTPEQQDALARSLDADARYLLQMVEKEPLPGTVILPEIRFLAMVWTHQGDPILWRSTGCKTCVRIS
jgi:transposase